MNQVELMNPLIVRVSPSPSLTTCPPPAWAAADCAPPSAKNPTTTSTESHASRILMTSSSGELACVNTSALHRSHGEALNESIDEKVIQDGKRNTGEQCGGHQGAPVVHIAADERDGDAQADGHAVDRADKRQRVHEFLHHQGESEDHHGQDARQNETRRDPYDYGQPAVAVDHGLLLDVP